MRSQEKKRVQFRKKSDKIKIKIKQTILRGGYWA